MRFFASSSSLLLPLLSLLTKKCSVKAHFLFAGLYDDEQEVRVFFSEPVAMAGVGITYVGDRLNRMIMIGPSFKSDDGNFQVIDLEMDSESGYMRGALPEKLDNTPYFITGFLDYGDFGEGDGPKADLQYTFSAQISSTNPSDDFSHFVHYVAGTDATSPYGEFTTGNVDDTNGGDDPFAIAMNNYGPPYRVVMRGVSASTPVRVCLYEGDGSNREVGCMEGTHNRTHHLTFDSEAVGVLRPCETYYALGNTTETDEVTGKMKNLWSSTSITWNGPCTAGFKPRAAVPQWYEPTHYNYGGCAHSPPTSKSAAEVLMEDSTSPSKSATEESLFFSSPLTMLLFFISGFLAGMVVYHIIMPYISCCDKRNSLGAHSIVVSADEKTIDCSDDTSSSEFI